MFYFFFPFISNVDTLIQGEIYVCLIYVERHEHALVFYRRACPPCRSLQISLSTSPAYKSYLIKRQTYLHTNTGYEQRKGGKSAMQCVRDSKEYSEVRVEPITT